MRLLPTVLAASVLAAAACLPSSSSAQTGPILLPGIPLLRQQHALTCESSAVSMGTRGQIVESQLMSVLPRSANPNLGFRGHPDGQQGTKLADYGVYAAPLQAALLRFGYSSTVISYGFDRDIKSYINRGWPVVAWVTYALQKAVPRLVMHRGVSFVLVPHEHAITIDGYDDRTVIANDPWTGARVRYLWSEFNRSWGYFGDMALAVEPCMMAVPVQHVMQAALTSTALTWTWTKAAGAAHYAVTVTRYGARSRLVYSATQDAPTYTVDNPSPGKTYVISVSSVSACGDVTAPASAIVQVPMVFPTPVPTASEATAVPPTGTPPPRPSATVVPATSAPTVTPAPTSTPHA